MLEQSLKCQEVLKREGCSRDPRLPQSWCEERLVEITPCGKSERPQREKAVREELLQNEVIPLDLVGDSIQLSHHSRQG